MHKNFVLALIGALTIAAGPWLVSSTSAASTTSVDLGITGSRVAGFTAAQAGQELPITFTMKNHSSSSSTYVDFYFTLTHASASTEDYVCPLISNHLNIFPDTPACEPGLLGAGKSTSAAILITPTISSGTVTVKACARSESGNPDPVSSNNCKTISIPIE
jgi:hypothetical protein